MPARCTQRSCDHENSSHARYSHIKGFVGGVPETPKDRREMTPAGANANALLVTVFVLSSRAAVRDVVFPAAVVLI